MKTSVLTVIVCCALLAACGRKVDEMKKSIDQAEKVADAMQKTADNQDEAAKVYEERKSKGDTVAMPYKDLQGFLPTSISGFKPDGGPSGSQQAMQGYSLSIASQNWTSDGSDGKKMVVTLQDWGGTQGAYGMASMAFALSMEMEDDNQKISKLKMDSPMTSGILTYKKQTHEVDAVAGTRYRYLVTASVTGATDDQTSAASTTVNDITKKLEGK